jgi:hypothetical protein
MFTGLQSVGARFFFLEEVTTLKRSIDLVMLEANYRYVTCAVTIKGKTETLRNPHV